MDPTTIQAWITSHVPSIWGPIIGLVALVIYQYARVKFPVTMANLPHLVALPASTPDASAPPATAAPVVNTTATSTNHPVINALLSVLQPSRVISLLTDEVTSMLDPPAATTAASPSPATTSGS